MDKKIKLWIGGGILIIGCICGYAFHPHSYKIVDAVEATCTDAGTNTYKCWCGKSYTEEIPATGHSYTEAISKEATCTEEGEKTFTCSSCGDTYTESVAALGHDYVINTDSVDADNCAVQVCSRCGDEIKAEHAFGYSETDKGKDYLCKNCGYKLFSIAEYSEPKNMYMQSKGDAYDLPLDNANVKQSYSSGDTVSIDGETGDYYVTISDNDGAYFYIKASLLTSTKPTQQATNTPKEETQAQSQAQTKTQTQTASQSQTQAQTPSQQAQSDAELISQIEALTGGGIGTSNPVAGQGTGSLGIGDDSNIHFE